MDERLSRPVFFLPALLLLASGQAAFGQAIHTASLTYPAPGNIRPAEGMVELWFRLDTESFEGCYFGLFTLTYPPSETPCLHFSYNDHLGAVRFRIASYGRFFGIVMANPYYGSALIGMPVKGETAGNPYPRHRALRAKEWHYAALGWSGKNPQLIRVHLDGRLIVPPGKLKGDVWDDLTPAQLQGPWGQLTVDELRISSRCRPESEIRAYWDSMEKAEGDAPQVAEPEPAEGEKSEDEFLAGLEGRPEPGFAADPDTLLLDHFTAVHPGGDAAETAAAVIAGYRKERGGLIGGPAWKRVRGRFGTALQLWEKAASGP
ncbi:MAG: hypothetical protein HYU36_07055 [Planctomycetes bacterium]|nr:hypothetical protein [Planctomycetota bacterium]